MVAIAIVTQEQHSSETRTRDRQQSNIINNNINTFSINIFVTMTSFPPSATRTPTRSDNGNGNRTPPQQQLQPERDPAMAMAIVKNADRQQSFINNNNVNTSAIKSIANTFFPPSATGTPQQQLQLQPERDPTMAMLAIATYCTKWAMALGRHQQGTRPCRTPGTIQ